MMIQRKHLLCGVAAAALMVATAVSTQVFAADLGVAPSPAPAYVAEPVRNWAGFYFGAHLGAGRTNGDLSVGSTDISWSTGGALAGLQLGYNFPATAGGLIWGFEADVSFADLTSDGTSHHINIDTIGSIRARLGMPVGNALAYVTAGAAVLAGTTDSSDEAGYSYTEWRPVAGFGVEAWVTDTISVRAEGLGYFGNQCPSGPSECNTIKNVYVGRIGINFNLQ